MYQSKNYEFKDDVELIRGLEGDNKFSSAPIKKCCDDSNISIDSKDQFEPFGNSKTDITTTSNPISEKFIQDKKEEKKAGKIISSLVRNAKMTPAEAKATALSVNDTGRRGQRDKRNVVKMNLQKFNSSLTESLTIFY